MSDNLPPCPVCGAMENTTLSPKWSQGLINASYTVTFKHKGHFNKIHTRDKHTALLAAVSAVREMEKEG